MWAIWAESGTNRRADMFFFSDHENIMHPDNESESLMKKHLNLETKAKWLTKKYIHLNSKYLKVKKWWKHFVENIEVQKNQSLPKHLVSASLKNHLTVLIFKNV